MVIERVGGYSLGETSGRSYIACHACGLRSYHPLDIAHRFCARCMRYHEAAAPLEVSLSGLSSDQALRQAVRAYFAADSEPARERALVELRALLLRE